MRSSTYVAGWICVAGHNPKPLLYADLDAHPYDWRVDKYERNRVW
jgi:hypothetical protein